MMNDMAPFSARKKNTAAQKTTVSLTAFSPSDSTQCTAPSSISSGPSTAASASSHKNAAVTEQTAAGSSSCTPMNFAASIRVPCGLCFRKISSSKENKTAADNCNGEVVAETAGPADSRVLTSSALTAAELGFIEVQHFSLKGLCIQEWKCMYTGVRVLLSRVNSPICNLFMTVPTEAHTDEGLPHTLEHLVFLGSHHYPYKGVLDLLAGRCLAQGTNAWTARDHTTYTLTTAGSEGLLNLLPVYLDHLMLPLLRPEAFKTEVHHLKENAASAGVVYCEMEACERQANSVLYQSLLSLLYPGDSGYRFETGGMMEEIRRTTIARVREYHETYYRWNNLALIFTGALEPKAVLSAVRAAVSKIDAVKQQKEKQLPIHQSKQSLEQSKQPLLQKSEQPLLQKSEQPLLQKAEQLVEQSEQSLHQSKQPLLQKSEQPLLQKSKQLVEQSEQSLQQLEQPLLQKSEQPLLQKSEQLVEQSEQSLQQLKQPLLQQSKQPLLQQSKQPLLQNSEQPLLQKSEQSVQQSKQPLLQKAEQREPQNLQRKETEEEYGDERLKELKVIDAAVAAAVGAPRNGWKKFSDYLREGGASERPWTSACNFAPVDLTGDLGSKKKRQVFAARARSFFPADDEESGRVAVGFRGPSWDQHREREALDILGSYLTDSNVARLQRELVLSENAACGGVSFSSENFKASCCIFEATDVKLCQSKQTRLKSQHQQLLNKQEQQLKKEQQEVEEDTAGSELLEKRQEPWVVALAVGKASTAEGGASTTTRRELYLAQQAEKREAKAASAGDCSGVVGSTASFKKLKREEGLPGAVVGGTGAPGTASSAAAVVCAVAGDATTGGDSGAAASVLKTQKAGCSAKMAKAVVTEELGDPHHNSQAAADQLLSQVGEPAASAEREEEDGELETIASRMLQLMKDETTKPLDMNRIRMLLRREILHYYRALETSPHDTMAELLNEYVVNGEKAEDLQKLLNLSTSITSLAAETEDYWVQLLQDQFTEPTTAAAAAACCCYPSKTLAAVYAKEEQQRQAHLRNVLGTETLQKLTALMQLIKEQQQQAPPSQVLLSVPLASIARVKLPKKHSFANFQPPTTTVFFSTQNNSPLQHTATSSRRSFTTLTSSSSSSSHSSSGEEGFDKSRAPQKKSSQPIESSVEYMKKSCWSSRLPAAEDSSEVLGVAGGRAWDSHSVCGSRDDEYVEKPVFFGDKKNCKGEGDWESGDEHESVATVIGALKRLPFPAQVELQDGTEFVQLRLLVRLPRDLAAEEQQLLLLLADLLFECDVLVPAAEYEALLHEVAPGSSPNPPRCGGGATAAVGTATAAVKTATAAVETAIAAVGTTTAAVETATAAVETATAAVETGAVAGFSASPTTASGASEPARLLDGERSAEERCVRVSFEELTQLLYEHTTSSGAGLGFFATAGAASGSAAVMNDVFCLSVTAAADRYRQATTLLLSAVCGLLIEETRVSVHLEKHIKHLIRKKRSAKFLLQQIENAQRFSSSCVVNTCGWGQQFTRLKKTQTQKQEDQLALLTQQLRDLHRRLFFFSSSSPPKNLVFNNDSPSTEQLSNSHSCSESSSDLKSCNSDPNSCNKSSSSSSHHNGCLFSESSSSGKEQTEDAKNDDSRRSNHSWCVCRGKGCYRCCFCLHIVADPQQLPLHWESPWIQLCSRLLQQPKQQTPPAPALIFKAESHSASHSLKKPICPTVVATTSQPTTTGAFSTEEKNQHKQEQQPQHQQDRVNELFLPVAQALDIRPSSVANLFVNETAATNSTALFWKGLGVACGIGSSDAGHVLVTVAAPVGYTNEREWAALAIMTEFCSMMEGVLYRAVRGAGFAYNCSLTHAPWEGQLSLRLSPATDPAGAVKATLAEFRRRLALYKAAQEQRNTEATETETIISSDELQAAKCGTLFSIVSNEETQSCQAAQALLWPLRGESREKNQQLLAAVAAASPADVHATAAKYMHAVVVALTGSEEERRRVGGTVCVVTNRKKVKETVETLQQMGVSLEAMPAARVLRLLQHQQKPVELGTSEKEEEEEEDDEEISDSDANFTDSDGAEASDLNDEEEEEDEEDPRGDADGAKGVIESESSDEKNE